MARAPQPQPQPEPQPQQQPQQQPQAQSQPQSQPQHQPPPQRLPEPYESSDSEEELHSDQPENDTSSDDDGPVLEPIVQLEDPNYPVLADIPVTAPHRQPVNGLVLNKRGARVGRPPGYAGPGYLELKGFMKNEIDVLERKIEAHQERRRWVYARDTGIRQIPADFKSNDDEEFWPELNMYVLRYNEFYPGEEASFRRQFAMLARHSTASNVEFMRP